MTQIHKKADLTDIIQMYNSCCDEFVKLFCKKQGIEFDFWIADKYEIASFNLEYTFDIRDIILDLNTNQPKGWILRWQDEGVKYAMVNDEAKEITYSDYIAGEMFW